MKESDQKHLASIESASATAVQDKNEHEVGEQPVGSFVALRRMSKMQVEAVRMQGCADGAGCE